MGINELNNAWISAGQKVSDLDAKLNAAAVSDTFDTKSFNDLKAKRDAAKAQRDALKDQLEEARATEATKINGNHNKPVEDNKNNDTFIHDFKAMIQGRPQDMVKESNTDPNTTGNGGLLVATDEQTQINTLLRQQANLQALVTTEHVNKPKGSRIIDRNEDLVAFQTVEEGAQIPELNDPKLDRITYSVADKGGITTVTNDQINDSDQNTLAWLTQKIAKYSGYTRSMDILAAMPKATKKTTIANWDDIKALENSLLDPSLLPGAVFLTNQSGYTILSQVKDARGDYMLQPDVTNPDIVRIGGHQLLWYSDKIVPDVDGSHPLYFGNFKEFAIVFDRQAMTVDSTNIGGGAYETNSTKMRIIDRYDVEVKDPDAIVVGSFKAVANQKATTPEASGSTVGK